MNNFVLSVIVPIASFAVIAAYAVGLGFVFYQVHHKTELGAIGVIGIGLALLILTPAIAFLLERASNK